MGRVRAKGKKLTVTSQEDAGSGEEIRITARKRRGRPQKSLKDGIEEDEVPKVEDEDSEDTTDEPIKDVENKTGGQNGKKQKRNSNQVKEKVDSVKEENENGTKSSSEESKKINGFRQNGSRRKNKPRRAAEAIVECN